MIQAISTIAFNAFRETVRDKILYNLVIFALGLICFSLVLGEWSVLGAEKVIKDFTLAVMSISGLLMSIFVGIGLVQKEIQRKTALTLLAKPIPRWYFIVGKYLGLLAVLLINLSVMTVFFYAILWFGHYHPDWRLLGAIYLIYWEMAVIVAVALLFSSFSTPTLSAVFTLGVYVAGHLSGDILNHIAFIKKYGSRLPGNPEVSPWTEGIAKATYYFIPNLENFNIRGRVVYDLPVPENYLVLTTIYGMSFIGAILLITCLWFNRRDFL